MRSKLISISYVVAMLCAILAIGCFASGYRNDAVGLLFTSIVIQFLFAFAAIAELNSSPSMTVDQKKSWRYYLLLSPLIFGFFYFKIRVKG